MMKMKSLIIISAFVVMLAMLTMPFPVFAAASEAYEDGSGFSYTLYSDTKTAAISKYSGTEEAVEIPEKIVKDDVEYTINIIGTSSFASCQTLKSITIPDSIEKVQSAAFKNCDGLESITIPDSVTTMGSQIFENCDNLKSVKLSKNIKTIGMMMFIYCGSLTEVQIPEGVTEIRERAFYNCSSLTSITIPDSVTTIYGYAFLGCSSLSSITVPESVTSIRQRAFEECSGLEYIYIPDGVEIEEDETYGYPTIPSCSTQLEYTSDENGNITITKITLGDGKTEADIPSEIVGKIVTSVAEEYRDMVSVSSHIHVGAAVCTQKAVCTICGEEYGEIAEHKQGADYACDASGHWHFCTECGEKLEFTVHISDGGVITKEATTSAEGVKTYSCKVCGYKIKTETIAKKPAGISEPAGNEVQEPVMVSKLTIKVPSKKLAAGKKVQLTLTVAPITASNKSVTWKTSNKKYAAVSSTGKLTLKKAGAGKTVTITATAKDGSGKKAVIKIKIMKHSVKSVKLTAPSKSLKAGKKMTLKAKVKTTGSKVNKTLKYTSSNTKYATVNQKGKVTAKKAGKGKTVTITAVSTDGSNKKAKVKIKIK